MNILHMSPSPILTLLLLKQYNTLVRRIYSIRVCVYRGDMLENHEKFVRGQTDLAEELKLRKPDRFTRSCKKKKKPQCLCFSCKDAPLLS